MASWRALELASHPCVPRIPACLPSLRASRHATAASHQPLTRIPSSLPCTGAFKSTCAALDALGCATEDVHSLLGLLAALLHLGNATFEDDINGNARPSPGAGADAVAAAGKALRSPDVESLLLHRSLTVRGELMRIDLRAEQADHLLRGLLKSLYTLGFAWIVKSVNTMLQNPAFGGAWPAASTLIDILDIFGFENFVHNSFEQLCINFANEKLHQLFLHTMFKAEEAVIARERVQLPSVECEKLPLTSLLLLPLRLPSLHFLASHLSPFSSHFPLSHLCTFYTSLW